MIVICILIAVGCLIAGAALGFIFGARRLSESFIGQAVITLRKKGYSEFAIADLLEEILSVPLKEGMAVFKQIEMENDNYQNSNEFGGKSAIKL
jgi:hypothetical protein